MARLLRTITLISIFALNAITLEAQKLGFSEVMKNNPDRLTTFCVPRNEQNINLLAKHGITIKYSTSEWFFITATPSWIDESTKSGELTNFYFELAPPSMLSDSARAHHFVDDVHAGLGGLGSSYTGKGVLVGYVDTGIDYLHEDFKDSAGNTRVLRYWDQTMPDNALSPPPYGYGFVWDSASMNNLSCTSVDNQAHGSTVVGQGSGDGSANGSNKGMAPDCNIIMVETDFSRPNWTLTVSDACDYIFKVADTLGMPAVVNLSLGTYFGSHDGNDPASMAIETLLDEKPGRIVVSAAGNSGAQGTYHQHGEPTSDTNFVWIKNNPLGTAAYGANTIFFDLWTDTPDATWDFAFGADTQGPLWDFRGRTNFHGAQSSMGVTIFDTIWNGANRLATIQGFTEFVGGNYHLELLAYVDSTNYNYRFETTGSGNYDLWSGAWLNFNDLIDSIPVLAEFPDSVYYVMPDSAQTIVSSWNCSEKVISVGNFRNRFDHIDFNQNPYVPTDLTPPGKLSPNSSKGPSRHSIIKPDISAAGDVSLATGPLWVLTNPAYNTLIDSGGMHLRNGGTSMASPVVAGIAALYLERCGRATYQDFKDDIIATAYTDQYTGIIPNNAYGNGKPHALNLLLATAVPATPIITPDYLDSLFSTTAVGYEWYLDGSVINGETNQVLPVSAPYGTYEVLVINADGCTAMSDPFIAVVSIEEIENNNLVAYPNPTNSVLNIACESVIQRVNLVDLNGNILTLERISDSQYNLKSIPSGVYILSIDSDDGVYYSKIVRL